MTYPGRMVGLTHPQVLHPGGIPCPLIDFLSYNTASLCGLLQLYHLIQTFFFFQFLHSFSLVLSRLVSFPLRFHLIQGSFRMAINQFFQGVLRGMHMMTSYFFSISVLNDLHDVNKAQYAINGILLRRHFPQNELSFFFTF